VNLPAHSISPRGAAAPAKALRIVGLLRRYTAAVLVLLLLAFVGGIEIARPGTVTPIWISNIILFAAPLGILAAGQTLVMLAGGIDLSVASVATASAYLMATHSSSSGVSAVLWGLAVGLAVGLLNGVGVAVLRVQPLVMTLGTGLMTEGTLIVYSQKMLATAPRVPAFIQALGSGKVLGGIPIDLFLWAPIAVTVLIGLRYTGFGRLLYAVGDNREACQLSGVRIWQVLLADYILCSLFAAAAGLVVVGVPTPLT
jgi:ribose transport system permease protein